MRTSAVWRWGAGHAARRPGTWALAAAALVLCPLATLLGPFPRAEIDPTWAIATSWSIPIGLIGASGAVAFLSRHGALLLQMAPRTRWGGELGTLLLGALAPQLVLFLGATLGSPAGLDELPALLARSVVADVHLAAVGILALRVPAPTALRIALLWALLWLVPALVGASRWAILVDPGTSSRVALGYATSARAALSSSSFLAFLLALGALAPPPRSAPGLR